MAQADAAPGGPGRLSPPSIVGAFIAAQLLFWTLFPALGYSAPPLDVTESLVWGREWLLGTHKHPPLPSWLLEVARLATGSVIWAPFLLSQICVGLTVWSAFLLGRQLIGAERAAAGALLLAGIFYFSWPTPEFNHNVVQMPIWAAVPLFLHHAVERGRWRDWLMLGLLGGIAIYGKYSAATMLLFVPLWLALTPEGRGRLREPGPWAAAALFVLLIVPEAVWLFAHDFQPLDWAALRSGGGGTPLTFLGAQIADHLPILLVAGPAGLIGRAMWRPAGTVRDRRYLLMFGLGPLILTVIGAVIGGSGLKDMWGMPMFALSGLILAAYFGGRIDAVRLRRQLVAVLVLVVLVSGIHGLLVGKGPAWAGLKPMRGAWPMDAIGAATVDFWRETHPDRPLRFVIGRFWTGGLAAMNAEGSPSVLLDGDPAISPWIDTAELDEAGAVIVWQVSPNSPLPSFGPYTPARAERLVGIPWPGSDRPPLVIGLARWPQPARLQESGAGAK
ncbi:MAG: glycosyltransferase family 39 protein [Minwuia sp.]|uniref:glycosyltransferase family 39 protein n=1 Tax=Minwuia sp. TaxID=2493630 RepID=UPI003A870D32